MFRTFLVALTSLLIGATAFAGAPQLWMLPRRDAKPEFTYPLRLVSVSDEFFNSSPWASEKGSGAKGFFASFPQAKVLDADGRDITATYRKNGGPRAVVLTDVELHFLMEKFQADRRFNLMQAPRLTIGNGESGNITLADQLEFLTGVSVQIVDGEPKVVTEKVKVWAGEGTPTVLVNVSGRLNSDGKSLRVHLDEKCVTLDEVKTYPVTLNVPTRGADGKMRSNTVTYKVQKPVLKTQQVDLHFEIPIGGTIMIDGGEVSTAEYRSRLFRSPETVWSRSRTIVLLSAQIAPQEDD